MTSTRVVYYINTPDGETLVSSSNVFAEIIDKLTVTVACRDVGEDDDTYALR